MVQDDEHGDTRAVIQVFMIARYESTCRLLISKIAAQNICFPCKQ